MSLITTVCHKRIHRRDPRSPTPSHHVEEQVSAGRNGQLLCMDLVSGRHTAGGKEISRRRRKNRFGFHSGFSLVDEYNLDGLIFPKVPYKMMARLQTWQGSSVLGASLGTGFCMIRDSIFWFTQNENDSTRNLVILSPRSYKELSRR